jgi:signal transduction histidine kinase
MADRNGIPSRPPILLAARDIPLIQWCYIGLATCAYATAAVFPPSLEAGQGIHELLSYFYYILLALTALATLIEARSVGPRSYFIAFMIHGLCTLVLAPLIIQKTGVELLIDGVLIVGICLFNPFPVNCLLAAAANALILLIRGAALQMNGVPALVMLETEVEYGLFGLTVTGISAFMVFYREKLIDYQRENERLDALVDRLTRANLGYQEYAKSVEEASTESERKRITRDIHDIVGYTLTNNITMMEAITDMMNINPLGVDHLVRLARTNAQEGLTRVRDALHFLRAREIEYPTGLRAVERLVRTFEKATGARVEFAFTEVSWDFSEDLDYTFYHVIQESLVNSFRHGKASLIRVFLTRRGGTLELKIGDNGVGASDFQEGIGLKGMRERLACFGGTLVTGPIAGGFEVLAMVPVEET